MGETASRVALITGGARGVGKGIAEALHHAGHRVVIGDVDEAAGCALSEALEGRRKASSLFVKLDVRRQEDFVDAVRAANARFGGLDILVNNAALTVARPYAQITPQEWDDVLTVNLRGVFLGCQVVAPTFSTGWGRVINLSSVAGQRGGTSVQGAHYIAAKAGIIALTRYFAQELAAQGVTVNAIAPGPIVTDQTRLAPPDKLAAVSAQVPVGRLGTVEEVGALAAFLVSDAAGFINGATYDINGGLLMR